MMKNWLPLESGPALAIASVPAKNVPAVVDRINMVNEALTAAATAESSSAISVMASYNEIDGMPSHQNRWLITDLLRGEWGFTGILVSDYFGVAELQRRHFVAADLPSAGRAALRARRSRRRYRARPPCGPPLPFAA